MAKALKQRWPISDEYRSAIVQRMIRIVASPQSTAREATAAAKALMSAEFQNQQDEHKVVDVRLATRHDRLAGIAAGLGIDISVIEDAERAASGDLGGATDEDDTPPADRA